MKKALVSLLLLSQLSAPVVRAAEVSVAAVGGMVATMGVVGLVLSVNATFGGGMRLKAEYLDEAVEVVALNDTSFMSYELEDYLISLREEAPELDELSDVELLKAVIRAGDEINL